MGTKEEFQTVEDKVRHVMKNHERARNDDDFLIWYIKHHLEDKNLNRFAEYKQSSNAETIRRNRQTIQNDDNDLLPTNPKVLRKRKEKEEEVRRYFVERNNDRETYEKYLKEKDN